MEGTVKTKSINDTTEHGSRSELRSEKARVLAHLDPGTVQSGASLSDALATMRAHRGDAVLVLDAIGQLAGILTERDLLKAAAGRVHSSEARVREWMTEEPVTATSSTSAEDAVRTMLEYGFRHLPVVEEGRTVGVVSLREVVRHSVMAGASEITVAR